MTPIIFCFKYKIRNFWKIILKIFKSTFLVLGVQFSYDICLFVASTEMISHSPEADKGFPERGGGGGRGLTRV